MSLTEITRYELPPEGTTLLGYIVRRMHKTELLIPIANMLADNRHAEALIQIAIYTVASATSFGRAYYQPAFNSTGDTASESDPQTGAKVTATLEERSPHYRISCQVEMPAGEFFFGNETITGTTIRLSGLGMPAPCRYEFTAPDGYRAVIKGIITSELAPSFFGPWRIRAYGNLEASDNFGNTARVDINRNGDTKIEVMSEGKSHVKDLSLARLIWQELSETA